MSELAIRAEVSPVVVYRVEAGQTTSSAAATRLASALGLKIEFDLTDPRKRTRLTNLSADPVHSAMGELEAGHLRRHGLSVGMDEPYHHFHYAGRADLVAWDIEARALLHIENRTRFPDFQDMAGSYNAKRAYLAESLGERLSVPRWESQTHVIAALWSAEVLHVLRLRIESFRSLCPDGSDAFAGWWNGTPLKTGSASILVVFDPLGAGRERTFIGLDEAMTARPRYRGYGDAAEALSTALGARAG